METEAEVSRMWKLEIYHPKAGRFAHIDCRLITYKDLRVAREYNFKTRYEAYKRRKEMLDCFPDYENADAHPWKTFVVSGRFAGGYEEEYVPLSDLAKILMDDIWNKPDFS